jgi:hypothetical protein
MIVALDAVLFPTARWALPRATLRPLASDLRSPRPSTASLHALLRNLQEIAPNPVCVLDGCGSYVKDLVRAFLPLPRRLEVLLADTNGRFKTTNSSSETLCARGIVDLETVGQRLGYLTDPADAMLPPPPAGPSQVLEAIQTEQRQNGSYVVAAFDQVRAVPKSSIMAAAYIRKLVSIRRKHLVDLGLFEVDCSQFRSGIPIRRVPWMEVYAPDLASLIYGSCGVLTNNPAVAHLSAQVGRACLAFWAGLRWRDHVPRVGPGIVLGADVPVSLSGDFPLGLAPLKTLKEAVSRVLSGECSTRNSITVQPSRKFLIEYLEKIIDEQDDLSSANRGSPTYANHASISMMELARPWRKEEER